MVAIGGSSSLVPNKFLWVSQCRVPIVFRVANVVVLSRFQSWVSWFGSIFAGLWRLEFWNGFYVLDPGGDHDILGFFRIHLLALLIITKTDFILRLPAFWFGVEDGSSSHFKFSLFSIPYKLMEVILIASLFSIASLKLSWWES